MFCFLTGSDIQMSHERHKLKTINLYFPIYYFPQRILWVCLYWWASACCLGCVNDSSSLEGKLLLIQRRLQRQTGEGKLRWFQAGPADVQQLAVRRFSHSPPSPCCVCGLSLGIQFLQDLSARHSWKFRQRLLTHNWTNMQNGKGNIQEQQRTFLFSVSRV